MAGYPEDNQHALNGYDEEEVDEEEEEEVKDEPAGGRLSSRS